MTGWSPDDHKWTGAYERRGSRDLHLMDVRKQPSLPRLNPTTSPHAQRPQANWERDARQSSRARHGPPGRIPMPSQRDPCPYRLPLCEGLHRLPDSPPATNKASCACRGPETASAPTRRARGIRGRQQTPSRGTHCALYAAAVAARPNGANMQPPRAIGGAMNRPNSTST
jgi:hypothetical protein